MAINKRKFNQNIHFLVDRKLLIASPVKGEIMCNLHKNRLFFFNRKPSDFGVVKSIFS